MASAIVAWLVAGFYIWMLIDAFRRRAEFYWFLIILFVPAGSFVYFFVVKFREYDLGSLRTLVRRPAGGPAPLTELRHRAEREPSQDNRLSYADGLERLNRHQEALEHYEHVLTEDKDNLRALHGAARCHLGRGEPHRAVERLARLMELDSGYRDYGAALDYAESLAQSGDANDAVDLLRGLVQVSPRLNHCVALAHYLIESGKRDDAREVLRQALESHIAAPEEERRRASHWARRAKTMLRGLNDA